MCDGSHNFLGIAYMNFGNKTKMTFVCVFKSFWDTFHAKWNLKLINPDCFEDL